MEETAEAVEESQKLAELEECLEALDILQRAFVKVATREELSEAEGRRCILHITGLKHHKKTFFFEVTGTRVRLAEPYRNYNTYIAAPLSSILRVFRGILAGKTDAFAAEWARGEARIVGERRVHDGFIFNEGFKRLATLVKRYREAARP